MKKTYNITPVAKPRMTQRDKRKQRPCVMKYWAFKDQVALNKVELPVYGASILFVLPMPKSWSKRRRELMYGQAHEQVPDLSNLLKALEDAVYSDDSKIWHYSGMLKLWGYNGRIEIITGV